MEPILPFLKTVLPYLTAIVTAALPAFTSRKDDGSSAAVAAQQIAELQTAVRTNAESVQVLAAQMQRLIQAMEATTVANQELLRRAQRLAAIALALAAIALIVAAYALGARR
jgi:hypothetical protein